MSLAGTWALGAEALVNTAGQGFIQEWVVAERLGSCHWFWHQLASLKVGSFLVARCLQGTQKVKKVLLLPIVERIEILDHIVRLGCFKGKEAPTAMCLNHFQ